MDKELIKRKIASSPELIRDLIYSTEIIDLADKISFEKKLSEEVNKKLAREILYVLIGIKNKDDFEKNLLSISIDLQDAQDINQKVNEGLFSKIQNSLPENDSGRDELSKETILSGIENPTPAKASAPTAAPTPTPTPAPVSKPTFPTKPPTFGQNPILDAQHELPEGEKKVMISSSAVPPRGPMLNPNANYVSPKPFTPPTPQPIRPAAPAPAPNPVTPKPFQQPNSFQPKPPTPPTPPMPPIPPKPAQTPPPQQQNPAPKKYSVDPYREPLE